MKKILLLLFVFSLLSQNASAKELKEWVRILGTDSAIYATNSEYKLVSGSGLSWPDGRQALVTYWAKGATNIRCIDNYNARMEFTGGACYEAAIITPINQQ